MLSPAQKSTINIIIDLLIFLNLINDKLCSIISLTDVVIEAVMLQLMFIL